ERLSYRAFVVAFSFQFLRRRIQPQRNGGRSANTNGSTDAAALAIERDLRCSRHEGKVALTGVDLVETDADPRLGPDRETRLSETRRQRQRGHHRAEEEIGGCDGI